MINESKVVEIINSNELLTKIILFNASKLDEFLKNPISSNFVTFNSVYLLQTIALQESTYGHNNKPRYEPAYASGGIYYKTEHLKNLYGKYGAYAACSWSSFQIMFITAYELGYREKPSDLSDDSIAIHWVINYIKNRILKFSPTKLEQVFDAYNSGSFRDKYIPKDYVESCNYYYKIIEKNFPTTEIPEENLNIVDLTKPKMYSITEDALNEMINNATEEINDFTSMIESRKSLIKYLTEVKEGK